MQPRAPLWIALYVTRRRLGPLGSAPTADVTDGNRQTAASFHSMAALAFALDPRSIPGHGIEPLVVDLDRMFRDVIAGDTAH